MNATISLSRDVCSHNEIHLVLDTTATEEDLKPCPYTYGESDCLTANGKIKRRRNEPTRTMGTFFSENAAL